MYAIRYAWSERLMCPVHDPLIAQGNQRPCKGVAPIFGSGGLPANPFLARIEGSVCRCLPPQKCDG